MKIFKTYIHKNNLNVHKINFIALEDCYYEIAYPHCTFLEFFLDTVEKNTVILSKKIKYFLIVQMYFLLNFVKLVIAFISPPLTEKKRNSYN